MKTRLPTKRMHGSLGACVSFFGAGGLLSRALEGYEVRPAQERLAEAVERTLHDGGLLLAEAGTGTGKTLAYLYPATHLDRRVVVSTGTKNLQEQLVDKDIPLLARALGRRLRVAVMKGRANYLCRARLGSFLRAGAFTRREEIPLFRKVESWAKRTRTGDRAEIRDLPDRVEFWREISAASESCLGGACPHLDECFVTRMRLNATAADIVVVNHHLLCADLAVMDESRGQVIPRYDAVILDEAHALEDVASQYFGTHVSARRVEDLCHDVERELGATRRVDASVVAAARAARKHAVRFFALIEGDGGRRLVPAWQTKIAAEASNALITSLNVLSTALRDIEKHSDAFGALSKRAQALAAETRFVVDAENDDFVYFVEARGRGVFVRAQPIDVSSLLSDLLFKRVRAAVLTSATLAEEGSFAYLKTRLGVEPTDELVLDSSFDYARQATLYVPRGMPDPQSPRFVDRVAEETARLLDLSRGRAFVLFTSHANMNAVAERLADAISYPMLVQGEAPKAALLEIFRATPGAVLLGTASFWQGVDVVGESLSCVIIDKLPFASPSDPVVAARIDWLKKRGGDPFAQYQVPVAILALKQGLGRLIRSTADRGILAVLDSRLVTRQYGRRFLASLPPARLVHDLEAIAPLDA
ncbi:MAG: ATP-dependent DNA helicase [Vicinamibacteria bacterium]|nr:ATP-dependent DNA helicase [Vicinamibacteria bacterium]